MTPTPLARERDAYEGAANAFAGFIPTFERLAKFDAYAFGPASSSELATLDPRQRLTLDAAAACARSRALDDDRRDDTTPAEDTGVYVGCAGKDYALLLRVHGVHHDAFKGIGNESSVVSGRVSFVFAFRGPSVSVDCACSSSLVAAVVALDGFALGASTLTRAFIAGASLVLTDDMHRVLGGAGMLSPCGRCRTFDRAADGYGRGEAVETLVASSRARDGAGGGTYLASGRVNQDGRSSSLTAPNGNAQRAVIRLAMTHASKKGLAFDDVTVHAHGTGTALGDPIETRASTDALSARRHSPRVSTLTFQSSKSWSGHTEPASGALTLVAAHVQVSRERLSRAVCHLRALSPHVENPSIRDAHTVFPRETARGSFARVNVDASAFAFQGTNAHVVTASTTMGNFETRAAKPTTHARRFWPTRAREILAVETRRARFIFTTSHATTTFSNALAVRAAFERAFDDDASPLARFVSRSVAAAEDRGTHGNGERVLLTVRVEADAASSSACVARARRRPVVVERVRRLFGALARAPSNRAATERVARARGFASAFDVSVAACEAMTATRDVDSNARLVVVETACGGLSCARDDAVVAVAVGVRRKTPTPRRRRTQSRLVAYELARDDDEYHPSTPTTARVASCAMTLARVAFAFAFAFPSGSANRRLSFVASRCGVAVTTVFRCARRECVYDDDVDDDSYVFASARPVRSLAMVSIEPRAATIRRDAVVVGGDGRARRRRRVRGDAVVRRTLASRSRVQSADADRPSRRRRGRRHGGRRARRPVASAETRRGAPSIRTARYSTPRERSPTERSSFKLARRRSRRTRRNASPRRTCAMSPRSSVGVTCFFPRSPRSRPRRDRRITRAPTRRWMNARARREREG